MIVTFSNINKDSNISSFSFESCFTLWLGEPGKQCFTEQGTRSSSQADATAQEIDKTGAREIDRQSES